MVVELGAHASVHLSAVVVVNRPLALVHSASVLHPGQCPLGRWLLKAKLELGLVLREPYRI